MSRLLPHTPVRLLVLAVALAAAWSVGPAVAQGAAVGTTTVDLARSAPAAKSLRAHGVRVSAVAPANATSTRWSFPASAATVGAARVDQTGGLTLRVGKRTAKLTALRLALGRTLMLSASLGGRRADLFTVTATGAHALRRSAAGGTLRIAGAGIALRPSGAKALAKALGLRRLASGRLGTVDVKLSVAPLSSPPSVPPASGPGPIVTPVEPMPVVSPPADPTPPAPPAPDPCRVDVAPLTDAGAPAGVTGATTEWVAPPGGSSFGTGDLRSWINYVTTCWNPAGRVEAVDGATKPDAGDKYRYRYAVLSATWDGPVAVIVHRGTIAYRGAHDIDTRVTDPVIRFNTGTAPSGSLAPGTGTVTASGQSSDRDDPAAPPVPYAGVVLMTLEGPTSAALPTGPLALAARLTADGETVFGSNYAVGADWGTFTVTAPGS